MMQNNQNENKPFKEYFVSQYNTDQIKNIFLDLAEIRELPIGDNEQLTTKQQQLFERLGQPQSLQVNDTLNTGNAIEQLPEILEYERNRQLQNQQLNEEQKQNLRVNNIMDTITKFIYQVNIKRFNFDHRFYFAHMLSGRTTIPGLAGHFHGMLSNENTVAGEVAPFSKVVESFLDSELKKLIGYDPNQKVQFENAISLIVSGGTEANFLALTIARNYILMKDYNINVSNKGLNIMVNSRTNKIIIPVMLISDTYHYSFDKIMNVLGLGMLNIIKLQSDQEFSVHGDVVDRAINEIEEENQKNPQVEKVILGVVSVFGSTPTGGLDKLDEINAIITKWKLKFKQQQRRLWWHIDAAFGGPFCLLNRFSHYRRILPNADSVTIDPHKMLWVFYNAGSVIFKRALSLRFISTDAPYLSKEGKFSELSNRQFIDGLYQHRCAVKMVGSLSSSGVLSTYLTLSCLGYDVIRSALNQTIKASLYLEKRLKEELNDQIRIYNHVEMNNQSPGRINILVWQFLPSQKLFDKIQQNLTSAYRNSILNQLQLKIILTQLTNVKFKNCLSTTSIRAIDSQSYERIKKKEVKIEQLEEITVQRSVICSPLTTEDHINDFIKLYKGLVTDEPKIQEIMIGIYNEIVSNQQKQQQQQQQQQESNENDLDYLMPNVNN